MKTLRAQLLFSVVMLLGLSACNKCTSDSQIASDKNGAEAANTGDKIFRYSRISDPKTLDPQAQLDSASASFINSIYDRIIDYHYLKRPYTLIPVLLKNMPALDPNDPLTYVFELKEGINFHDNACFPNGKGRELVADDVLYTIKRFADININTNSWFMMEGVIKGLDAFHEKTKNLGAGKVDHLTENVSGLKKLGKYKFAVTLTRKNPLALYSFAVSSMSIVPHEAVTHYGDKFRSNPVGTGAFILEEYRKKQTMVLKKNTNYHMSYPTEGDSGDLEAGFLADAGKKLPLVDEVVIDFIPEAQPNMLKFEKGEIDWVAMDKDNFTKMVEKSADNKFILKPEFASKYTMYTEPGLDTSYMVFNMKHPVIGKNKYLRQALVHAFDPDDYIKMLNNGRGVRLSGIVPHSIAGSENQISDSVMNYDIDLAINLMEKAGYPKGKGLQPIVLTMPGTSSAVKDSFEYYRAAFAKIGVILKPNYLTFPKYLKVVDAHNFEMATAAWVADYPDAENFYQLLYGKSDSNNAAFVNKEFDALYEQTVFKKMVPRGLLDLKR
ncbi:MAG: ABC transporter substrate-binding protein [Bdellovibrionota bacterium]